jgi:hypothetical protein
LEWKNFAMENLGIFYDLLVYFTAVGNMIWPFGIFCGHLAYFSPFWYGILYQEKSGNPATADSASTADAASSAVSIEIWRKKTRLFVYSPIPSSLIETQASMQLSKSNSPNGFNMITTTCNYTGLPRRR